MTLKRIMTKFPIRCFSRPSNCFGKKKIGLKSCKNITKNNNPTHIPQKAMPTINELAKNVF
jgi:hypothetical protein